MRYAIQRPKPVLPRLCPKVSKPDMLPRTCWVWTGGVNKGGYGLISVNGRRELVHRWVYETFVGPIPAGQVVRHRCDNRRCCRPSHLRHGTRAQNTADMIAKGRDRPGGLDNEPWGREPAWLERALSENAAMLAAIGDERFFPR